MKPIALGLALAIVVVACAAAPRTAQPPLAPSKHDEIEQLSAKIESRRGELGLEPGVAAAHVRMATPTCVRSEADRCKQACTISDDICGDAKKICDLAAGMPGDPWAKDKCDGAQATCTQAQDACCRCQ